MCSSLLLEKNIYIIYIIYMNIYIYDIYIYIYTPYIYIYETSAGKNKFDLDFHRLTVCAEHSINPSPVL